MNETEQRIAISTVKFSIIILSLIFFVYYYSRNHKVTTYTIVLSTGKMYDHCLELGSYGAGSYRFQTKDGSILIVNNFERIEED